MEQSRTGVVEQRTGALRFCSTYVHKNEALSARPFSRSAPLLMKRLASLVLLLAAVAFLTPRAEAQFSFLPYGGYDFDVNGGTPFVGAGAEFGVLPDLLPVGLVLRPSAEYYFTGDVDDDGFEVDQELFVINADLVAQLAPPVGFGVFAGAGLGAAFSSIENVDLDIDESSTELGLNLLAGIQFGSGFTTPFVQGRYTTLGDADRLAVMGGVRFSL